MKEGLIKLTSEDNLFYDSITKQYKKRMHCPYCGKYSGCWCFDDLLEAIWDESMRYCSDRCFVLDTEDLADIAEALHITIKPTMEEWNASKIVKEYWEEAWDSIDGVAGSPCGVEA